MSEQQTDQVILQAKDVVKTFGSGNSAVHAVANVSLQVSRGELVMIKGPSGSGKTTLLSILGGLMKPNSGEVEIMGQVISKSSQSALAAMRAREIGFVFQAYNLLAALSVEENILFPSRLVKGITSEAKQRAEKLIKRLDLGHRRKGRPDQLSGGEKQRVALARALINDPPLILADEPTGNLDSERGSEVAMLLHDIARDDNRAVVIVTHDERIEGLADRVLWLEDGALRDRKQDPHEWTIDPVCGMKVDRWVANALAEYNGRTYAFCTKRCHEKFIKNPEEYAVKQGA